MADRATAKRGAAGRPPAGRSSAPKRATRRVPERDAGQKAKLHVVRLPARRPKKDPAVAARTSVILLLVSAALLTTIGVVEVFSASSVYAFTNYDNSFWFLERQAIYAAIGIGALLLTARMRYTAWRRMSGPLVVISVVLLLLALHPTAGSSVYGASRWIGLGPFTLQPSEFAKLALIAFTAAVLAQKEGKLDDWLHLALPLGPVVLLVAGIVMLQRDLGTTIVIVGSVLLMLFVAGARLRHLTVTGVITLAGLAYLIFGTAYRRARFLSFFDPWKDPLSNGYQLIQGLIALGSGGWFGVGLGASRQKWAYLPNAHTDFIFAVLGEELGLIGELVVLVAFGVMIYAGIRIAVRAPDTFGRLLAAGITSWIGSAGDREPRRGDGAPADHRRPAALRVVRGECADRHARRRRRARVDRPSRAEAPERARPARERRKDGGRAGRAPRRGGHPRERGDRGRRDGRTHLPRALVGGLVGPRPRRDRALHRIARRSGGHARPCGRVPLRRDQRRAVRPRAVDASGESAGHRGSVDVHVRPAGAGSGRRGRPRRLRQRSADTRRPAGAHPDRAARAERRPRPGEPAPRSVGVRHRRRVRGCPRPDPGGRAGRDDRLSGRVARSSTCRNIARTSSPRRERCWASTRRGAR